MIISNPIYLQKDTEIITDDDAILIREEQLAALYEMLNQGSRVVPVGNIQPNFFSSQIKYISGWKGTGKTTTIKWFMRKISSPNFDSIYINCRIYDTPSKLIEAIKSEFMTKFPQIGMSSNEREYLVNCVRSIEGFQFFLLIDEIDKPLRNSKTPQKDEFLHFIARLVTENTKMNFKIILTTNVINIENMFSDEVNSFIGQSNHVRFRVYSVPELQQILEKRAVKALVPGSWSIYDLALISQATFYTFESDARKAIEILYTLAKLADTKIDILRLQEVVQLINADKLKQDVSGYPISAQHFLVSIAEYSIDKSVPEFTPEQAFKLYYDFCVRNNITKTVSIPQLYRYINMLEEAMVVLSVAGKHRLMHEPKIVLNSLANIY